MNVTHLPAAAWERVCPDEYRSTIGDYAFTIAERGEKWFVAAVGVYTQGLAPYVFRSSFDSAFHAMRACEAFQTEYKELVN